MNKDQALVPSTAMLHKVGTAPGMWMKKENTVLFHSRRSLRNEIYGA
jgi:hypothetical protein